MIPIHEDSTIGETFLRAAQVHAARAFLAVPANPSRAYHPKGFEISYGEAVDVLRELMAVYAGAGYALPELLAALGLARSSYFYY